MKKICISLTTLVLTLSTQVFANGSKAPIEVEPSTGDYACAVKNDSAFSQYRYLGRGETRMQAEAQATNACLAEANFASNCSQASCERDPLNKAGIEVEVEISKKGAMIEIIVRDAVIGAEAVAKNQSAFSQKVYYAQAPTSVEAKALAMNACLGEANFASNCEIVDSRKLR